jgi:hypothetical protein
MVEQQKGANASAHAAIRKQRTNRKAIAHPVGLWALNNAVFGGHNKIPPRRIAFMITSSSRRC